ncbi:MAG: oxygen-independent coproporphyrinogen III oxidase-like protein [Betaproteobacteria bacterium]|nr:MAG: oxygen-independent coproporphyrinogen III oxidase-like protein [Betaproteobacteria bacterium]
MSQSDQALSDQKLSDQKLPERNTSTATIMSPGTVHLEALPPLSIYVHIPWCVRKCPYCDFNSHEAREDIPESAYIDALISDLESTLPSVWGRTVHSIFIGGGTPSLLAPESIERLLLALRARVMLLPDAEITLEANPGTVEAARFDGFRTAGVTRLSVGVQSLNAQHLRALGRIHDVPQAQAAIEAARSCFENINVDLMYALPDQTLEQALSDVRGVLEYAPQHVSAYHLTIEPNTYFHRYPPQLPDHDAAAEMQQAIESLLASHGYDHYETSAFAQPGHRCRHNLNYWQFGDYLGIGAGAHSKLSFPDRITRQMRYKQPSEYLRRMVAGEAIQTSNVVPANDLPVEFMMNALRLTNGVERRMFSERTGLPITAVTTRLAQAVEAGLLVDSAERLRATLKGQRFLNDLLALFVEST